MEQKDISKAVPKTCLSLNYTGTATRKESQHRELGQLVSISITFVTSAVAFVGARGISNVPF